MGDNIGDAVARAEAPRHPLDGWVPRGLSLPLLAALPPLLLLVGLLLRPAGGSGTAPTVLPGLAVGAPAPPFRLRDSSGAVLSLAGLRGHPVLINFWSVTCSPCRQEMPALALASRSLGAGRRGSVILGISGPSDSPAAVDAFARAHGAVYPLLRDTDFAVTVGRYHVADLPTSVFVDAQGRVRAVHLGALSYAAITDGLARLSPARLQ